MGIVDYLHSSLMHPTVCTLIQYLQQHPVQFRLLAKKAPLANISYREIELTYPRTSITMPVFDEFSDLELDSPIVYLSAGYGLTAIHKRVQGIANPTPPAGVGYDSQKWFIPKSYRRNQISAH